MRHLMLLERRLQDLERRAENIQRHGEVSDIKFEKNRWWVKMKEGSGDETLNTDWMPWKSHANGTVKFSIPPRKGQKIVARSPNGEIEQALAESYHYDPKSPSPHDKEDEVYMKIEDPDGQGDANKTLTVHATKDSLTVKQGQSQTKIEKNKVSGQVGDQKHVVDTQSIRAMNSSGHIALQNTGNVFMNC